MSQVRVLPGVLARRFRNYRRSARFDLIARPEKELRCRDREETWMYPIAVSLRVRIGFALTALAVALFVIAATLTDSAEAKAPKVTKGPAGLKFYKPPKDIPSQHGTLIWARKAGGLVPLQNARYTKLVLYSSRTAQGQRDAISGSVSVPRGKPPKGG